MSIKHIVTDWEPKNEYTTPLKGKVIYRNSGIIKAIAKSDVKISVGKIVYEKFDEENFQYIISPFWHIIDGLSSDVFQGIPGIDMEMRLKDYYRVNYEPVFITERSPSKNREDLWELMESVGLDYYDRFEWLIRTNMRAGNDNLIVERMRDVPKRFYYSKENKKIDYNLEDIELFVEEDSRSNSALKRMLGYMQYGDRLVISELSQLGKNSEQLSCALLNLIYSGISIKTMNDDWVLDDKDFSVMIPVLRAQVSMNDKRQKEAQSKGIQKAKQQNKYKGRKKKDVNFIALEESYKKFKQGSINIEQAMELANINSKSTYYRRIKELF